MSMSMDQMSAGLTRDRKIFDERIASRIDELKWLYIELYENDWMFAELLGQMEIFYGERTDTLKKLDIIRETHPD